MGVTGHDQTMDMYYACETKHFHTRANEGHRHNYLFITESSLMSLGLQWTGPRTYLALGLES